MLIKKLQWYYTPTLSICSSSIKTWKKSNQIKSSLYLHCVWTLVAVFPDGKMLRSSSALVPLVKCSSEDGEKGDVWRRSSELTGWDEEEDCSRHICNISPGVARAGLPESRAPPSCSQHPWCQEAAPLNKWQTGEAFIEQGGGVGLASWPVEAADTLQAADRH